MIEPGRIGVGELVTAASEVLEACGVDGGDATLIAASLVDADRRGIHSHGVSRLGIYRKRILAGGNSATAQPVVVVETPTSAVIDAQDGLSQVASALAVKMVAGKARAAGVAVGAVRGGSHFGAAGYWARALARDGLVGIVVTNTTPLMVPWGGRDSVIGTNPIAFAFPSSEPEQEVVIDLATSETTWGALVNAASAGSPVPATWALAADGQPTTDAAEAVRTRRLLPFGRHKGYAIAVAVELLGGALTGSSCLDEIADMYAEPDLPMRAGHLFVAIDPGPLSGERTFPEAVRSVQSRLHGVQPQAGVSEVLWPGQLEARRAHRANIDGIELPEAVRGDLGELLALLGLPGLESRAGAS